MIVCHEVMNYILWIWTQHCGLSDNLVSPHVTIDGDSGGSLWPVAPFTNTD